MRKFVVLLIMAFCNPALAQSVPTKQFNQYIQSLPNATTPLNSNDQFYVLQNGLSKKAPKSAVSTGGGGGGGGTGATGNMLQITRADIPNLSLGTGTFTVNGFITNNDHGFGATYSSVGATCPNGVDAITGGDGTCYNLVRSEVCKPGWFGAPGDDGATTITALDITNNTQWKGTYTPGTTWDTVGTQEAIYCAFAQRSTPGSIVWNAVDSHYGSNVVLYVDRGFYGINRQLNLVISSFTIRFAQRQGTEWDWVGAAGGLMAFFNSASYGLFENFSFQCNVDQNFGSQTPCIIFDHTPASPGGLKTQQLTFVNLFGVIQGINGQGMAFNWYTGGSGQGDTITFVNPIFIGNGVSTDWAINIIGSNALDYVFNNGDCQGFIHDCVVVTGGTAHFRGSHFENENLNGVTVSPFLTQFNTSGADVDIIAGNGGNEPNTLIGVRSEAEILMQAVAGIGNVYSAKVAAADFSAWQAAHNYTLGQMVQGGGGQGRAFMMVDGGGACSQWCRITGGSGTTTIQDSAAAYTPGALVGLYLFLRFGSNGFTHICTISANTAQTITSDCTLGSESMYYVGGKSGLVEPTWASAATGYSLSPWYTTANVSTFAGSNCVGTDSGFYGKITVGDWLVIPYADQIAPTGQTVFPMPLYARVTSKNGAGACPSGVATTNNITINKNAGRTMDAISGISGSTGELNVYGATPITDGAFTWINISYDTIFGATHVDAFNGLGRIGLTANARATVNGFINGFNDPIWLDPNSGDMGPSSTSTIIGTANYYSGSVNNWVCDYGTLSGVTDMSGCISQASIIRLVPSGDITFNAPTPTGASQELVILITTSGTTNYTITFGTNFKSNGTLSTGVVSGATYAVTFRSLDSVGWQEVSRSTSNAAGTNSTTASPTAPANVGTYTMQGLAGTITPVKSGNVQITVSGTVIASTSTLGSGISYQISYGSGTAPANGGTLAGAQVGTIQTAEIDTVTPTVANVRRPFSLSAVVSNLTLGRAAWIDLAATSANVASGLALSNVNVAAHEF